MKEIHIIDAEIGKKYKIGGIKLNANPLKIGDIIEVCWKHNNIIKVNSENKRGIPLSVIRSSNNEERIRLIPIEETLFEQKDTLLNNDIISLIKDSPNEKDQIFDNQIQLLI